MEGISTETTPKKDFQVGQEFNVSEFGESREDQWGFPTIAEIVPEKGWEKNIVTPEDLSNANLQLCSTDDYRYVVSALYKQNPSLSITSVNTWVNNWDIIEPTFRNRLHRINLFREDLSFLVADRNETIKRVEEHSDSPIIIIYNQAYTTGHIVDGNKRLIALMKNYSENPESFKDLYLPIWVGKLNESDRQRYNLITSLVPKFTPGSEKLSDKSLSKISIYLETLRIRKKILQERNTNLRREFSDTL
jgi:hypothetical protein